MYNRMQCPQFALRQVRDGQTFVRLWKLWSVILSAVKLERNFDEGRRFQSTLGRCKMSTGRKKKLSLFIKAILVLTFALIATETGVRLSGISDVPTYAVGGDIGYIPKPSQSGKFLNKNSWVFNDRSMGTESRWTPTRRPNILLIGNSIVMGGNPYAQNDKLGPLIQRGVGERYAVWPIAAGGWTNVNEIAYLEKNPDVVMANNFFIWEYMSGGLSQLSQWRGEYVWPSKKPMWAAWYVLRRYVFPRFISFNINELPPTGHINASNLANFEYEISKLSSAAGKKTPGIIFLYPDKAQLLAAKNGMEWLPERKIIENVAATHGLRIVDVARSPEWNEGLYRDGTHPTPEGNTVLARILTAAVTDAFSH
jgi:hypothetical protein